jgi:hypothetical protein
MVRNHLRYQDLSRLAANEYSEQYIGLKSNLGIRDYRTCVFDLV